MNRPVRSGPDPPAIFAVGALVAGLLAGFTLLLGLAAAGGGHGTYGPWYAGLALSALTWLGLALSAALELRRAARGARLRRWFWGVLLLLTAATLLGLWGLSG